MGRGERDNVCDGEKRSLVFGVCVCVCVCVCVRERGRERDEDSRTLVLFKLSPLAELSTRRRRNQ